MEIVTGFGDDWGDGSDDALGATDLAVVLREQLLLRDRLLRLLLAPGPLPGLPGGRGLITGVSLHDFQRRIVAKCCLESNKDFLLMATGEQPVMALVQGQQKPVTLPLTGSLAGKVAGHTDNAQLAEVPLPDKPFCIQHGLGLFR